MPLQRLNELVRFMTELVINRSTFEQHYAGLAGQVEELKLSTARLRRVAQKLETDYEARALGGNLILRTAGPVPRGRPAAVTDSTNWNSIATPTSTC